MSATSQPSETGAKEREYVVCPVEEFPEGTKRILPVGRYGIGVYNVKGAFYAIANHCPHEGGPLCQGTGTTAVKPEWSVRTYPVKVVDGMVVVVR